MAATLPSRVQDTILHVKTKDSEEIVLPVTRYDNVMNSPHLVETPESRPGAPFHLLETDSETLTASEIRRLAGGIL